MTLINNEKIIYQHFDFATLSTSSTIDINLRHCVIFKHIPVFKINSD